jgi:hypothetical protein
LQAQGKQPAFSDIDDFVESEAKRRELDATSPYALPDAMLVTFRIMAVTGVAAAAFVLAGVKECSHST